MMKKIIKGAIVLTAIIAFFYFGTGQHISDDSPDCKAMEPLSVDTFAHFRTLDFSNKTRLTSNKFGFRKKLVIEEVSIVTQDVGGAPDSSAYYGIYRDEQLREPVEEVDFNWLYRDGAFEEGKTDTVPYDEKKDGIVILEPGTYYAAVYTPSFFEDFEASYLSYICPLNQQGELRENETKKFYVVEEGQKNTFTFKSEKNGEVKITINIYSQGTMKIYDDDGVLLQRKTAKKNTGKPLTLTFHGKKDHTYRIEIEDCEVSNDANYMYLYKISCVFV